MIIGTVLVPTDVIIQIASLGAPCILVVSNNPAVNKAKSIFFELETKRITHEIHVLHTFSGLITDRVQLHVQIGRFTIKVYGHNIKYMASELANNMIRRPRVSDGVREVRMSRKGSYCVAKSKIIIAYTPLRKYMLRALADVARLIGILNVMEQADVDKVADGVIRIDDLLQTYGESDAALTRAYENIEELRRMFDD